MSFESVCQSTGTDIELQEERNRWWVGGTHSFYWFLIENCHVMLKLDNRRFCHIRCKYIQRQKKDETKGLFLTWETKPLLSRLLMAVFGWVTHSFQSTAWGGSAEQPIASTRPEKHRRRRMRTDSQSQIWEEHSAGIQRRTRSTEQLDADQTGTKRFQFPSLCFYTCTLEYLSENGWKHFTCKIVSTLEVIWGNVQIGWWNQMFRIGCDVLNA